QQFAGSLRDQGLAAVTKREYARATVKRRAEVVAAAQLDFAGVQCDPDLQLEPAGPRRRVKGALDVESACRRFSRADEYGEDAVALAPSLDHCAGVPLDGAIHDLVVLHHRLPH